MPAHHASLKCHIKCLGWCGMVWDGVNVSLFFFLIRQNARLPLPVDVPIGQHLDTATGAASRHASAFPPACLPVPCLCLWTHCRRRHACIWTHHHHHTTAATCRHASACACPPYLPSCAHASALWTHCRQPPCLCLWTHCRLCRHACADHGYMPACRQPPSLLLCLCLPSCAHACLCLPASACADHGWLTWL